MAAMPTTAIRVAATPACRQISIRMVPPCIGGDIVHTDCARDGFNPGDPKKQPPKMVRLANVHKSVHKSVHKRHENGPRRSLQGPFFAGSGDWIRICDLWVMSEPVAGSRIAVGLIRSGRRRSTVQPVSPRRLCSHRIHHVLFSNPCQSIITARRCRGVSWWLSLRNAIRLNMNSGKA